MKLKTIAALCVCVLTLGTIFSLAQTSMAVPPKKNPIPSDYYTGLNWQEAIKQDKPIVIEFYVDWCHYCKKYTPFFDSLRIKNSENFNFVIVKADDKRNEKVTREFQVRGYPTVFIYDPKTETKIKVQKRYNLQDELDNFLKK